MEFKIKMFEHSFRVFISNDLQSEVVNELLNADMSIKCVLHIIAKIIVTLF